MYRCNRSSTLSLAFVAYASLRMTAVTGALLCAAACSGLGQSPGTNASPSQSSAARRTRGSATFTVYTAGKTPGFLSTAAAIDIAPDDAGNMWFTDGGTPAIGRISPGGTVTEFTAGLPPGALPYSIVAGANGNMWFSDYRGVAVGEVTPDGTITEYYASQYTNSKAMGIAIGAHGRPWIVGFGSQPLLAYLTPKGAFETQMLPTLMTPKGSLASDANNDLWFVAQNPKTHGVLVERRARAQALRRALLHVKGAFEPCCPNVAPKSIVIGPDGNPWFTTLDFIHRRSRADYFGTYKDGKIELFRVRRNGLTEPAIPSGIASGAHALWMTGGDPFSFKGALWHIDLGGRQKAYNLPYNPRALTADASGNPWFTTAFPGEASNIVEVTF
jgi:streptogramin lyase